MQTGSEIFARDTRMHNATMVGRTIIHRLGGLAPAPTIIITSMFMCLRIHVWLYTTIVCVHIQKRGQKSPLTLSVEK